VSLVQGDNRRECCGTLSQSCREMAMNNRRKFRYISKVKEERRISWYPEITQNPSSPFNSSNVAIPWARLFFFFTRQVLFSHFSMTIIQTPGCS